MVVVIVLLLLLLLVVVVVVLVVVVVVVVFMGPTDFKCNKTKENFGGKLFVKISVLINGK